MRPRSFEHHSQEPGKESEKEKMNGEIAMAQRLFRRYAPYLVAMLSAFAPGRSEAQPKGAGQSTPDTTQTLADRLPMEQHKGAEQSERDLEWPGGHVSFFSMDSTGTSHFEPWSIIYPAQTEFSRNEHVASQRDFKLPYELSRLFDTGEPLRPEDHEKIVQFIDQELKKEYVDRVKGLDFSKRLYKTEHPASLSNHKITNIQFKGTASPEGPRSMGSASLEKGSIEPENIELGEIRAEVGEVLTKEAMARDGLTPEKLQTVSEQLDADELQLSDDEYRELFAAADSLGYTGADDLECIYNLVVDYNDNKVTDPNAIAVLDRTIASKRSVQVTVSYEGDRKETFLVPLPLLLLAFLPLRRWRRDDPPPPETELDGTPPKTQKERPAELDRIPEKVWKTPLPEEGTKEFEEMEESVVVDDLWQFYDDPRHIELGIDYHSLTLDVDKRYETFESDEEREVYLANEILEAWKQKDRRCRELAGASPSELDRGLDYENQPRQIQYARLHARELLRLVNGRRSDPGGVREYREFLRDRTSQLMRRRTMRQAGDPSHS